MTLLPSLKNEPNLTWNWVWQKRFARFIQNIQIVRRKVDVTASLYNYLFYFIDRFGSYHGWWHLNRTHRIGAQAHHTCAKALSNYFFFQSTLINPLWDKVLFLCLNYEQYIMQKRQLKFKFVTIYEIYRL